MSCQGEGADELRMIETTAQDGGYAPEPRRLDLALLPPRQAERFYLERFMAGNAETNGGSKCAAEKA